MMVYEPENNPAAPTPHIARPMIRAVELGAAPVRSRLSAKRLLSTKEEQNSGEEGRRKRTADYTAQLEEEEGGEISPLKREEGVQVTP